MGSSSRPSSQTTTQVRQEYPAYFQPYLEQVLGDAQSQFGREYVPFPEGHLVETPAARTEALTALQDPSLAALSQPHYEAALAGTEQAGKAFPELDIESYMNPYRDLVTDQLLRRTKERRDIGKKGISSAAALAGAYGGGRHGVEEGLYEEGTEEQLQDIEDRSKMASFENALAAAQADRASGLAAAGQRATIGAAQQEAKTKGLIGIEKAATAEEALAQRERDIGKAEFYQQEQFPQQKLAEYSAIIRGHTPPASRFETTNVKEAYSPLQMGVGAMGALGGMFGGGKKEGGVVGYHTGGGLSGLNEERFEDMSTEAVVNRSIHVLQGLGTDSSLTKKHTDERGRVISFAHKEIEDWLRNKVPTAYNKVRDRMGMHGRLPSEERRYERGEEDIYASEYGDTYGESTPFPDSQPRSVPDMDEHKQQREKGQWFAGLEGLAYGGVPGQAYTEDIGMVGGLGAVAGPQMRFAYGGVPGQPYTEDIGMMGGLASVAGPQMRFQNTGSVPSMLEMLKAEEARQGKDLTQKYLQETIIPLAEKFDVGPFPSYPESSRRRYPYGYDKDVGFTYPRERKGDPRMGASGVEIEYTDEMLQKLRGDVGKPTEETEKIDEGFTDSYGPGTEGMQVWDIEEKIKEKKKTEPEFEDLVQPAEEEDEESWHQKYLGLDKRETIGASLMLMGGRTEDLVGVGKTLLSKKDATALEKKYKEGLIKLNEAKTETEEGRSKRDLLRILSTMHKNNRDFRVKVRELAQKIMTQDGDMALKTWEAFSKSMPMYAMTIMGEAGADAEEMKKNPAAAIDKFKAIVSRMSNAYPPQGQVTGVASVAAGEPPAEKATGGSIPNTLSKLGISSIRKV